MKPAIIRQYMQRPPLPSQFYGTWAVGKEPDALSKLVTGGIFHVQKLLYAGRGDASPSSSLLDPPLRQTDGRRYSERERV